MLLYNQKNKINAQKMRKEPTPWERKLWRFFLKEFRPRIYRQRCISNYILDFYCSKARLGIELDGSGHYEEEQQFYDDERTQQLAKLGIKIIRVLNFDVDKNFDRVCEYIKYEIEKRTKTPLS